MGGSEKAGKATLRGCRSDEVDPMQASSSSSSLVVLVVVLVGVRVETSRSSRSSTS